MSAKSALKKLVKAPSVGASATQRQLAALQRRGQQKRTSHALLQNLPQELKTVSGQALTAAAAELTMPLNPILSWFNESPVMLRSAPVAPAVRRKPQARKPAAASANLAMLPFKSPPCKQCPAKQGNPCRCAMKKYGLR